MTTTPAPAPIPPDSAGKLFFRTVNSPDRLYEILSWDRENHRAMVRDAGTTMTPFPLDTNLLKLLHWTLEKGA